MFRTMTGVHAPEFIGDESDWINTRPLKMSDLRGRAVLIDFWDYTCVNCIRTLPYIKEWHARYKDKGLIIVGVHTPEFEFAKERENVEEAVDRFGIEYPVLLDSDYQNWSAYANRYWPHKYLVGPDGRIFYDHIGEGGYGDTETIIQGVLKEINSGVALPQIMEPVSGENKTGAVCYPMTPELYLGYERGVIGNVMGYHENQVVDYVDPGNHVDGKIYAHGPFYNGAQYLRHARKTAVPDDYIAIKYHGLEVNAVIRPADGAFFVDVCLDGRPIDPLDAGADIHYIEGRSILKVDESRMYRIVSAREYGFHDLKLSSNSDSFAIYAFTFGSCAMPA